MSSEAAHFPEALSRDAKVCEVACGVREILVAHSNKVSEEPNGTVDRSSKVSDERLLEQVRHGDKEALAHLFRRHARTVRNVAYRILRNEAEADDLVQEVFLSVFRKASVYDSERGKAATWIIHVAYHRAFDRRRYLNSRHFYASVDVEDTTLQLADQRREVPFHERSIDGILGKRLMAKFNSRLTSEQRETIQLFFFEGYALKEIAELTGRSLVNVRGHYYRGLERLRKFVLSERPRSK